MRAHVSVCAREDDYARVRVCVCAGVRVYVFESLSVCACKSVTMRARVCECVRAREGEYASVSMCACVSVCARALLEALLGDALPVQARVPAARSSHLFLPLQSHCYQRVWKCFPGLSYGADC